MDNNYKPLNFYANFVTDKVRANNATYENYIAVDNMLPNKGGIIKTQYLPKQGTLTKFLKNDILIGNIRPYFKKIWFASFEGVASQDVLVLRNNNKISPKFLYFFLSQNEFFDYVMKGSKGSKMPRGDKNHILNYPILCVENEKIIGNFLFKINKKIENNNKISAKLEQMAKLIYDYYFVQFDYPDENGKPYKSSGGAMKYNEILKREIPINLEIVKIKDILNVKTGKEDANFSTKDGKYPFFTCAEKPLKCDISAFYGNAILVAGNGSFAVNHYTGNFNAYQRTYVLIPPKKYYSVLFIEAEKSIKKFKNNSRGSIIKFITKGDIENISIIKDIDGKIYNLLNGIFEQIELLEKENQKLSSLRDFLLPMLMNGQVSFKN